MKQYIVLAALEADDGDWVQYEDARVEINRLREALRQIRDHEPDGVETLGPGFNDGCEACEACRLNNWPPSHLCDTHYQMRNAHYWMRKEIERRNMVRIHAEQYDMRAIARDALGPDAVREKK